MTRSAAAPIAKAKLAKRMFWSCIVVCCWRLVDQVFVTGLSLTRKYHVLPRVKVDIPPTYRSRSMSHNDLGGWIVLSTEEKRCTSGGFI
jgi:hypothetical protein